MTGIMRPIITNLNNLAKTNPQLGTARSPTCSAI